MISRPAIRVVAAALIAAACGLDLTGTPAPEHLPPADDVDAATSIVPFDGSTGATRDDAGDAGRARCEDGCADAGGACDKGACKIACTGSACGRAICPPGVPCEVTCSGTSCKDGVDCGRATECTVTCTQGGACGDILCTGGMAPGTPPTTKRCKISCRAGAACSGTITTNAQTSEIECTAGSACKTITCGGGSCNVTCKDGSACGDITCCAADCRGAAPDSGTCP